MIDPWWPAAWPGLSGRERALGWAVWRGEGAGKRNSLAKTTAAVTELWWSLLLWFLSVALGREEESCVTSLWSSVVSWSWAFSGTKRSPGLGEREHVLARSPPAWRPLALAGSLLGYDRWLNCLLAAVCLMNLQELSTKIISVLTGNVCLGELTGLLLGCCSWPGS